MSENEESSRSMASVLLTADLATIYALRALLAGRKGAANAPLRALAEQIQPHVIPHAELPEIEPGLLLADADGELWLTDIRVAGEVWLLPFSDNDATVVTRSKPAKDGSTAVGTYTPAGFPAPAFPLSLVGRIVKPGACTAKPSQSRPVENFPVLGGSR